jgi:hypothetical protein
MSSLRRWILSRAWRGRRQVVRRLAPAVPEKLRRPVTQELLNGMTILARRMTSRLAL